MNNVIKLTMVAGLLALTACSDDTVSGSAIEGNAVADNSSSSIAINSSNSNAASTISFSTVVTSAMVVDNAQISVYGEENGAAATCTADEKFYSAKMKISYGVIEQSLEVKNLGSTCDRVLDDFMKSCSSVTVVDNGVNAQKSCDENGTVRAFCYDDRANPIGICTNTVPSVCTQPAPDTTVDFNAVLNDFMSTSAGMCNEISKDASTKTGMFSVPSSTSRDVSSSSGFVETSPDPVDSEFECDLKTGKNCEKDDFKIDTSDVPVVDPRQELPSYSAVGIDTNSNRSFIIKPNVETLNVSDAERSVLDSLARAYPRKTKTDAIDGMTIFLSYAAEYRFTTEMDEYYVRGDGSERSEIDVYREEKGVKSSMVLPLDVYYGGQGYISVTTLQVSESSILYLVRATLGSYASLLIDPFRTECEATSGSFYEYGPMADVAVACAVKNFSGITFDGILSQQKNLFRNAYATFVQPVVD